MQNNEQLKSSLLGWGGYSSLQDKIYLDKEVVYMKGPSTPEITLITGTLYMWVYNNYYFYTKNRTPSLGDVAFCEVDYYAWGPSGGEFDASAKYERVFTNTPTPQVGDSAWCFSYNSTRTSYDISDATEVTIQSDHSGTAPLVSIDPEGVMKYSSGGGPTTIILSRNSVADLPNAGMMTVLSYDSVNDQLYICGDINGSSIDNIAFDYNSSVDYKEFSATSRTEKLYPVNIDGSTTNKVLTLSFDYEDTTANELFFLDKNTQCLIRTACLSTGRTNGYTEGTLKQIVFDVYDPNTGMRLDHNVVWGFSNQPFTTSTNCRKENISQGLYSFYCNGISEPETASSYGFSGQPTLYIYSPRHKKVYDVIISDIIHIDTLTTTTPTDEMYFNVYNKSKDLDQLNNIFIYMYAPTYSWAGVGIGYQITNRYIYELNVDLTQNPCYVEVPTVGHYTVTGNPTIDGNCIAKNLNITNYISTTETLKLKDSSTLLLNFTFKVEPAFFNDTQSVTLFKPSDNLSGARIILNYNKNTNKFIVTRELVENGYVINVITSSDIELETDTKYNLKWDCTTSTETISYKKDLDKVEQVIYSNSYNIFNTNDDFQTYIISPKDIEVYLVDTSFSYTYKTVHQSFERSSEYTLPAYPYPIVASSSLFYMNGLTNSQSSYISTDGETWTNVTSTTPSNNGSCGASSDYIFIHTNNKTYYSADGVNWNFVDTTMQPGNFVLLSASVNNKHIVANYVSPSNQLFVADGSEFNWETVSWSSSLPTIDRGIAYNGKYFVGLHTSNNYINAYTSPDCLNWANQTIIPNSNNKGYPNQIAWVNNTFIFTTTSGYVGTSTDGASWTISDSVVLPAAGGYSFWTKITYGDNKYITLNPAGYIATSTDGLTWTISSTSILGNNAWHRIEFNGSYFIALSNNGLIAKSVDGTTWTDKARNENLYSVYNYSSNTWSQLCWDNQRFVAISTGSYISTSLDGLTWSIPVYDSTLNSLGSPSLNALVFDGVKYIFHSAYTRYIVTTYLSFHSVTNPISNAYELTLDRRNNRVLVYKGTSIYSTTDGETYTQITNDLPSDTYAALDYDYPMQKWVYCTDGGTKQRYLSDDLQTWTADSTTTSRSYPGIKSTASYSIMYTYTGTCYAVQDYITSSIITISVDWNAAEQDHYSFDSSFNFSDLQYNDERYPSIPSTEQVVLFPNSVSRLKSCVSYNIDFPKIVLSDDLIVNQFSDADTAIYKSLTKNMTAGSDKVLYIPYIVANSWNGDIYGIINNSHIYSTNAFRLTSSSVSVVNTSLWPRLYEGPKYINHAAKVEESGLMATIDGVSADIDITKDYDDECYSAIIIDNEELRFMTVSTSENGAKISVSGGYVPNTGSFEYRGVTYYYARCEFSGFLSIDNVMNLPYIYMPWTDGDPHIGRDRIRDQFGALKILQAYNNDNVYSTPVLIKDYYNDGNNKLKYKWVASSSTITTLSLYDAITGDPTANQYITNELSVIPISEKYMVLTSSEGAGFLKARYINLLSTVQDNSNFTLSPNITKLDCNSNTEYLADNQNTLISNPGRFYIYPVAIASGDVKLTI